MQSESLGKDEKEATKYKFMTKRQFLKDVLRSLFEFNVITNLSIQLCMRAYDKQVVFVMYLNSSAYIIKAQQGIMFTLYAVKRFTHHTPYLKFVLRISAVINQTYHTFVHKDQANQIIAVRYLNPSRSPF